MHTGPSGKPHEAGAEGVTGEHQGCRRAQATSKPSSNAPSAPYASGSDQCQRGDQHRSGAGAPGQPEQSAEEERGGGGAMAYITGESIRRGGEGLHGA